MNGDRKRNLVLSDHLCECMCGQFTFIAPENDASKGWVRGEPLLYLKGHNHRSQKPLYVVENRGFKTPCWIWQRSKIKNGYGVSYCNGKKILAHRMMYEVLMEPIKDDLELDHLCRIRDCIHPYHLEQVTHAENGRRGVRAKLTHLQVEEIRKFKDSKLSGTHVGKKFGVSKTTIYGIFKGKTWVGA